MKRSFANRVKFNAWGRQHVKYTLTDDLARIVQKVESICPTAHIHEFQRVDTTYTDLTHKML